MGLYRGAAEDECVRRSQASARAHGNTVSLRIQTRGGGEGGLSRSEPNLSARKFAVSPPGERLLAAGMAVTVADRVEHWTRQPAVDPQPSGVFFSQGLP